MNIIKPKLVRTKKLAEKIIISCLINKNKVKLLQQKRL